MARQARKYSNTKIYHIMLRGVNKQDIFIEEQDKYKFLKDLEIVKEKYHFKIYAYCLMPNHVHLLIRDMEDTISTAMHSLGIRYSAYMNKKYERVGHLFQNRYLSKPVENKEYLLYLQRYIHQNPQKAGIEKVEKYKWSSYQEYVYDTKIVDTIPILRLFSEDRWTALKEFVKYHHQVIIMNKRVEEEFEFISRNSMTDEELIHKIKKKLKIDNIYRIQQYQKETRNAYIRRILEITGTNMKQVARVIGVSERTIYRVKKEIE